MASKQIPNRCDKINEPRRYWSISEVLTITHKWTANIQLNKKYLYIGIYKTEEEAARAYDEKAKELHGEFARLNFPEEV